MEMHPRIPETFEVAQWVLAGPVSDCKPAASVARAGRDKLDGCWHAHRCQPGLKQVSCGGGTVSPTPRLEPDVL